MAKPRGDLDFPLEAIAVERRRQLRTQDLDRDASAVLEIFGEKYRGHPAASHLGLHGVMLAQCFAQFFE